ncbi:ribonuclease HI family protein [Undibacterium sp. Di26W]|uniref:ribonuclease HI family protein n=1 Tax=Undibacterium sp. Di26W TaxID=3413035 RepID=UPI003BEFB418
MTDTAFTYAQLVAIATRAERKLGLQQARQQDIPASQALEGLLLLAATKAGVGYIVQLAELRLQQQANQQTLQVARRMAKAIDRKNGRIKTGTGVSEQVWQAWFDGSAVPNPGKCRFACVLQAPDGQVFEYVGHLEYGDSCDAEFSGLILTLKQAHKHGLSQLLVHGDSQVVIDEINQRTKSSLPRMIEYRRQLEALCQLFEIIQIKWIPRHKNSRADALAQHTTN